MNRFGFLATVISASAAFSVPDLGRPVSQRRRWHDLGKTLPSAKATGAKAAEVKKKAARKRQKAARAITRHGG